MKTQDQKDLKLNNLKVVYNLIESKKSISRAEIAKGVHMSSTSITRIVSDLTTLGFIYESHVQINSIGRSSTILCITKNNYFFVCANIDSNKIDLAITDLSGEIIASLREKLASRISPETVCDRLYSMYQELIRKTGIDTKKVVSMGVSVIGFVDKNKHNILFVPQFNWSNVPLCGMLSERFGMDICIDNNVKSMLRGVLSYSDKYDRKNVAFLDVGTGVGSAYAIHGKILEGAQNTAGELGHIIIQPNGIPCDCGRKGCLQTFLAENAIITRGKTYDPDICSLDDIMKHYEKNTVWAVELVKEISTYISIAIINLSCMFNPDVILVSGELFEHCPFIFDMSMTNLKAYMFAEMDKNLEVLLYESEKNPNLSGAFQIAKDKFVDDVFKKEI